MSELPSKFLMLISNLKLMKFIEEIYSQITFIEIIVIIVKEHLQRLCNKYFSDSIAYSKFREDFNICRQLLFQCQQ